MGSAALVLGGVDCNGPHLYTVYPHGSTDSLPYVTMGSGSLAAMAVFESEFKSKMTEEEAKKLVHAAIMAGINNDLGSGGSVDLMVIDTKKQPLWAFKFLHTFARWTMALIPWDGQHLPHQGRAAGPPVNQIPVHRQDKAEIHLHACHSIRLQPFDMKPSPNIWLVLHFLHHFKYRCRADFTFSK